MADTETCERCKREIPSVNFVMHLAHCLRNSEICQTCGEVVPKASSREHFEEFHQKIECKVCGMEVESKAKVEEHARSVCPRRKAQCSFCELELALDELNEHESYCGSRTEKCESCGMFVLIRDLDRHRCESEVSFLPCEFCEKLFPCSELEDHQAMCPASNLGNLIEDLQDQATDSIPDHDDHYSNKHEQSTINAKAKSQNIEAKDTEVFALPCEICGELCPSDRLITHQDECMLQQSMPQESSLPNKNSNHEPPRMPHAPGRDDDTEDPFVRHMRRVMGEDFEHFGGAFGRSSPLFQMRPSSMFDNQSDPFSLLWRSINQSELPSNRTSARMYFS